MNNPIPLIPVVQKLSPSVNGPSHGKAVSKRKGMEKLRNGRKLDNDAFKDGTSTVAGHGTALIQNLGTDAKQPSIEVPSGWNRIIEKGEIVYISPNKSRLRSMADIVSYLMTPATCKCGLVCPFRLEEVFNFNPDVLSTLLLPKSMRVVKPCVDCKVNEGFDAILPQFSPEKLMKLLRKGSKKKRKKSKNPDKEIKKKNPLSKAEHRNDPVKPQSTQSWLKSGIQGSTNQFIAIGLPHDVPENSMDSITNNHYHADHSDYLKSFKGRENVTIVGNIAASVPANFHAKAPNSKKPPVAIVRPAPSSHTSGERKTMASKNVSKKSSSKRVPKSKEDITIASMMGRVKQQVGDLDKVRTSQMFSSSNQALSKQTATSTLLELNKNNANENNEQTTGKHNSGNSLSTSTSVLNLIGAKGPPNITLPPSHSSILPHAFAEGAKGATKCTEQNEIQQPPAMEIAHASLIEPQQLNWIQDPRLFSGKATTNVYWGPKEQSSLNEVLASSAEVATSLSMGTQISDIRGKGSVQPVSNDLGNASSSDFDPTRVATTHVAKCETLKEKGHNGRAFLPASNSAKEKSSAQVTSDYVNDSKIKSITTNCSDRNIQQIMDQGLPSTSIVQYPVVSRMQTTDALLSNIPITSSNPAKQVNHAADQLSKQNITSLKDIAASNENQRNAKSSKSSVSCSLVTAENSKISPIGLSQVVSQISCSNPVSCSGGISTVSPSASANSVAVQQNAAVGYQSYFGISNSSSVLRAPSAPYQNSVASSNPAQFLIMGSQASQALQHLALQQNNALQVSLQRADNPHALYLQTMSNYPPKTLKTSHQNIGFAYANVPIQFMTIGGAQVLGKPTQAQTASMERYQNLYQYYQGVRPAETGKADSNKLTSSQATALMYPGGNPFGQTPNNYVRIAPASVSNRIPIPPQPGARPPVAAESLKGEQQYHDVSSTLTVPYSVMKQTNFTSSNPTSTLPIPLEKAQKPPIFLAGQEKNQILVDAKLDAEKKEQMLEKSEPLSSRQEQVNSSDNVTSAKLRIKSQITEPVTVEKRTLSQNISSPSSLNDNSFLASSIAPKSSLAIDSAQNATKLTFTDVNSPTLAPVVKGGASKVDSASGSPSVAPIVAKRSFQETPILKQGWSKISNTEESEDHDELNLQCNEYCNTASENSRTPTPEENNKLESGNATDTRKEHCPHAQDCSLRIGDLIWGHQKGYSAWPGKIVNGSEVQEQSAETGKVWVMWFGEHTHSQMELGSLKSLHEGLSEHRSSCKRRKNRSAKKTAESLEIAIAEALQEAKVSGADMKESHIDLDDGTYEAKKIKR